MSNLHIDDDTITELQEDNIGGQRSKIDVIATILYICLEGKLKNHIIGKGNLSDSMSNHYLSILLYRNLLESYKDEGNGSSRIYYRTTRKGRHVIEHYNEIQKLFSKEGSSKSSNNNEYYSSEKARKYMQNNNNHLPPSMYRILIIDDESDITSALKNGLELQGFKVDVFNEPLKALSNYTIGSYDLLIVDIKMPKMNGLELYNVIRKLDKQAVVCFWTGFEVCYEQLRKMFPIMDEKYLIQKPIGLNELTERIQNIMSSNIAQKVTTPTTTETNNTNV